MRTTQKRQTCCSCHVRAISLSTCNAISVQPKDNSQKLTSSHPCHTRKQLLCKIQGKSTQFVLCTRRRFYAPGHNIRQARWWHTDTDKGHNLNPVTARSDALRITAKSTKAHHNPKKAAVRARGNPTSLASSETSTT